MKRGDLSPLVAVARITANPEARARGVDDHELLSNAAEFHSFARVFWKRNPQRIRKRVGEHEDVTIGRIKRVDPSGINVDVDNSRHARRLASIVVPELREIKRAHESRAERIPEERFRAVDCARPDVEQSTRLVRDHKFRHAGQHAERTH